MKRWVVNILCGLSLLLCVAIAILWVRSYQTAESILRVDCTMEAGDRVVRCFGTENYRGRTSVLFGKFIFSGFRSDEELTGMMPLRSEFPEFRVGRRYRHIRNEGPELRLPPDPSIWKRFGFYVACPRSQINHGGGRTATWSLWYVQLPHWFLCLLAACPPVFRVRSWLWPRRPRPGFCVNCGYDLRATPQRCPECGTEVVQPPINTPRLSSSKSDAHR